jgi:hypothetical protein
MFRTDHGILTRSAGKWVVVMVTCCVYWVLSWTVVTRGVVLVVIADCPWRPVLTIKHPVLNLTLLVTMVKQRPSSRATKSGS